VPLGEELQEIVEKMNVWVNVSKEKALSPLPLRLNSSINTIITTGLFKAGVI